MVHKALPNRHSLWNFDRLTEPPVRFLGHIIDIQIAIIIIQSYLETRQ
jgi:hypothetical protein